VLRKVRIKNYRVFRKFELSFTPGVNILVGDNDAGKSTLLEAINLALTFRLHSNSIAFELSPYLFNLETVAEYLKALRAGKKPEPPTITIEAFFDDDQPQHARFIGNNNLEKEDGTGVRILIRLDDDFREEYAHYVEDPTKVTMVPTEYYRVDWLDFGGNPVRNSKFLPDASLIDASAIRLQNGADFHLQLIISGNLDPVERVELARSYRTVREDFAGLGPIGKINAKLAGEPGEVSDYPLSLGIDISQRTTWERSLVPHLGEVPFRFVGKGEQSSLKILLALQRKLDESRIILIEEPENHLSFSRLNILIDKITKKCADRQAIITTHSSFVLNKLGLDGLILLTPEGGMRLTDLRPDTVNFFKKLAGYDTLRVVLARRLILVEGDSDDLVVQRAYLDTHGKLPIYDGVDVLDVDGLTAKRYLDIAVPLKKRTAVINDNDGDRAKMEGRYDAYQSYDFIKICVGKGDPKTLEPQLLDANGLDVLNRVLETNFATDKELLDYMANHKTDCALKIFASPESITMPEYIRDAVA
jgi:putative ATP-dependent endonuclease of OLD family